MTHYEEANWPTECLPRGPEGASQTHSALMLTLDTKNPVQSILRGKM